MAQRNINDPRWKALRFAAMKRDDFTCQYTGQKGVPLEVHHIKPVSKYPELEFVLSNLITLSKEFHTTQVNGNEAMFEAEFQKIISEKTNQRIHKTGKKVSTLKKEKYRPRNPWNRYG